MGYKLKRILIYPDGVTEKQVRPPVYEYNFTGNTVPELINIAKSGLTISKVIIEMQGSDTSTSGYGYTNIGINNGASSLAPQR